MMVIACCTNRPAVSGVVIILWAVCPEPERATPRWFGCGRGRKLC